MTEYRVLWEIDLEADTPQEAALNALRIHRDPESIATVFKVNESGSRIVEEVDVDGLDFESSASRQHFVDTGDYLHLGEAIPV